MPNQVFLPISGVISNITSMSNDCCSSMISIRNNSGLTNFILSPSTYVVQEIPLLIGTRITAFYDSSLPVPLIFPPQYQAVFITRTLNGETVYAGYFDEDLISEDNSLKLNIGRTTTVLTSNGQRFSCSPGGHLLLVYYTSSTRSIPAQTTPKRVIVIC